MQRGLVHLGVTVVLIGLSIALLAWAQYLLNPFLIVLAFLLAAELSGAVARAVYPSPDSPSMKGSVA
jgi:multisubunit Na+/H+ antiporter MnhG subunit